MIYTKDINFSCKEETAIMLGNFDGFHLGHQKLYKKLSLISGKYKKVIFSFYPHPKAFFSDKNRKFLLTSKEKAYLFEKEKVDIFMEYPFEKEFVNMEPEIFVKKILKDKFNCKAIVVGEDYCFGKGRKGNVALLKELGKEYDFEVFSEEHVVFEGEKVSSTNIRKCIEENNFEKASKLMGRPYFIMGYVLNGKRLGRKLGFPTVNVFLENSKITPQNGVYVTQTLYKDKAYNSMTNIGTNPTVENCEKRSETYIKNFNKEIYDEEVIIYFFKYIRGEFKFSSIEELKNQIARDVAQINDF